MSSEITCCVCGIDSSKKWLVVADKHILTLKPWRSRASIDKPICGESCAHKLLSEKLKENGWEGDAD